MKLRYKYPNICAECARENISQEQLAQRLGVSNKTIYNWQSGATEIPASALVAMARMWNVSSDYLLGIKH